MDKTEAYRIVFEDMTKEEGLLTGHYDAKNGGEQFMFGVSLVMEYIAGQLGEEIYCEFSDSFTKNMLESERKAGKQE